MPTNVPPLVFSDAGVTGPTEAQILAGVIADIQAAFGGALNLSATDTQSLKTPQGQLASSEAAMIADRYSESLFLYNNVDPAYASGRMQDGICRINFVTRQPAEATVVVATCTGLADVVIPPGALARATDGNVYLCQDGGTIPDSGSIDLTFVCQVTGPIACPIGALATIYRIIPGWDTVYNNSAGVVGRDTETRAELETRRQLSVAANARGTNEALRGALLGMTGVLDAYVIDNPSASSSVIRGVTLGAYQLFAAVVGATDAAVAKTVWRKKAPGAPFYSGTGTVTVVVDDDESGYNLPYPQYTIKFVRPASLNIYFTVQIKNSVKVPSDAVSQIQAAIISAFNGGDGGPRASIGSTIFASRFFAAVASLGSWVNIVSLTVGSANVTATTGTAAISGTVMTVSAASPTTLAVGQVITGVNIAPGTRIESLGSGTGGTGTYNVNITQTAASAAFSAISAANSVVEVNLDQTPALDALNIKVTLI